MPANTPTLGLPYPTQDDTVDVPRDVQALAMAIDPLGHVPVGAVFMWASGVAPNGYLLMQGQQVSAATYPGLATVLGQVGGNVTIPDMRDVFPVGAGPTMALGTRGGLASVTLSLGQMPSHNHTGLTGARDRSQAHTHVLGGSYLILDVPGGLFTTSQVATSNAQGDHAGLVPSTTDPADHLHSIPAQGGNAAHENRPPYLAFNFIIRAA